MRIIKKGITDQKLNRRFNKYLRQRRINKQRNIKESNKYFYDNSRAINDDINYKSKYSRRDIDIAIDKWHDYLEWRIFKIQIKEWNISDKKRSDHINKLYQEDLVTYGSANHPYINTLGKARHYMEMNEYDSPPQANFLYESEYENGIFPEEPIVL